MWRLGKLVGQRQGWWTDPGRAEPVDEGYGIDGEAAEELTAEQYAQLEADDAALEDVTEELGHRRARARGRDDDLASVLELVGGMDLGRDDLQHGMIVYVEVLRAVEEKLQGLGLL